jgi:hypothetical protein
MARRTYGMHSVDPQSVLRGINPDHGLDSTFRSLLESYLQSVDECKINTLEELVKFNEDHAGEELPPSMSTK